MGTAITFFSSNNLWNLLVFLLPSLLTHDVVGYLDTISTSEKRYKCAAGRGVNVTGSNSRKFKSTTYFLWAEIKVGWKKKRRKSFSLIFVFDFWKRERYYRAVLDFLLDLKEFREGLLLALHLVDLGGKVLHQLTALLQVWVISVIRVSVPQQVLQEQGVAGDPLNGQNEVVRQILTPGL